MGAYVIFSRPTILKFTSYYAYNYVTGRYKSKWAATIVNSLNSESCYEQPRERFRETREIVGILARMCLRTVFKH